MPVYVSMVIIRSYLKRGTDRGKAQEAVSEIRESGYFKKLKEEARDIREKRKRG
jgi:hypothetical protein